MTTKQPSNDSKGGKQAVDYSDSESMASVPSIRKKNMNHNYTTITNKMRKELIQKVIDEGVKIAQAALELNLNYSTAKSIIRVYRLQGRANKIPHKKRVRDQKLHHKRRNGQLRNVAARNSDTKMEEESTCRRSTRMSTRSDIKRLSYIEDFMGTDSFDEEESVEYTQKEEDEEEMKPFTVIKQEVNDKVQKEEEKVNVAEITKKTCGIRLLKSPESQLKVEEQLIESPVEKLETKTESSDYSQHSAGASILDTPAQRFVQYRPSSSLLFPNMYNTFSKVNTLLQNIPLFSGVLNNNQFGFTSSFQTLLKPLVPMNMNQYFTNY